MLTAIVDLYFCTFPIVHFMCTARCSQLFFQVYRQSWALLLHISHCSFQVCRQTLIVELYCCMFPIVYSSCTGSIFTLGLSRTSTCTRDVLQHVHCTRLPGVAPHSYQLSLDSFPVYWHNCSWIWWSTRYVQDIGCNSQIWKSDLKWFLWHKYIAARDHV